MKKRKMVAVAGGIVTTLWLAGVSQSFAQTVPAPQASMQTETAQPDYDTSNRPDMSDFGVQADDQINDADLEETSRQILMDEGFSPSQIYNIFSSASKQQTRSMRGGRE